MLPSQARRLLRPNSLSLRLVAAAALWSALALAIAGIILVSLFRENAQRNFDQRLELYLTTLVGALAAERGDSFAEDVSVGEALFENPGSGWYWQVSPAGSDMPVLTSRSLVNDSLDLAGLAVTPDARGYAWGEMTGPAGEQLRFLERTIRFEPAAAEAARQARAYDILVTGDTADLNGQVANFTTTVVLTLAVFGLGLVLSTVIQVRWGLRPLDRIRRGLADLRSGKEARFEGPFPAEIEPLARELNAVLQSNHEIVERARTHVGNLAHALKTPLSVITNEARGDGGPMAAKVAEQAELMRRQVNHYLERARIAARVAVIGAVTEVEPATTRLVRAMNRLNGERGVTVTATVPAGARFRGEQQDFEEVLGNLVDNACKWARSSVAVSVRYQPPPGEEGRGSLTLLVDDDGPGLTPEQRAEAARRGKRLDESKPGSGLGLSIVTDVVALYGGTFRLADSPAGGLRAEVVLPAA